METETNFIPDTGRCLIVPMQVQALSVGSMESEQKGSCFMPPTASFLDMPTREKPRSFVSGHFIPAPFQTGSSPGKGIHLHWFLPDALAQARSQSDGNDTAFFPVVPNRWLVMRVIKKIGESAPAESPVRAWVVESDFLSTDTRYSDSANIPYDDPETPFRYMGRALPLEAWPDTPDPSENVERFERLTVLGYGDPAFSIYYPNCRNVFSFHDPLDPDEAFDGKTPLELAYMVVGWYTDPADDPIHKASREDRIETLLQRFRWAVAPELAEKLTRTLCCSMITNIQWSERQRFIRRDMKAAVGIGNTVSEGLSALLAGLTGGRNSKQRENALEALQAGRLDRLGNVDALAELNSAMHKNSFSLESAGMLWCIVSQTDGGDVSTQMTPEIMAELDALNRRQSVLNIREHNIDGRRKQAFLDWYKYMLFKYDADTNQVLSGQGIDAGRFRDYLTPNDSPDAELAELREEITRLGDALLGKLEPMGHTLSPKAAPRYFRPNDPVILLAGNGLKPTMKHAPGQTVPCIPSHSLMGPGDIEALFHALGPPLPDPPKLADMIAALPDDILRTVKELYYLDCALSRAVPSAPQGEGSPGDSKKRLTRILAEHSAFFKASAPGKIPAATAINTWARPWNPLFMHWRVEYRPIGSDLDKETGLKRFSPDLITSWYQLSHSTIDLEKTVPSRNKYESYDGIVILNPNAVKNFDDVATAFTSNNKEDGDIPEVKKRLRKTPILAQALTGFHDALIMRQPRMQFPVDDPLIDPGDNEESHFHRRMRDFVGSLNLRSPTPNRYFNPIRAGRMRIATLRVVDTFGRYRDIAPERIYRARNLMSKSKARTDIFLPPRLAQPARLTLRWLGIDADARKMDQYGAASPFSGWLLPNFLDQSMMIFDADGDPVGVVRPWQGGRVGFRSYPGQSPEFTILMDEQGAGTVGGSLETAIPGNPALQHIVAILLKKGAPYLSAMLHTLDRALGDVAPDDTPGAGLGALLSGRPVALIRVGVNLELKGPPAINQGWDALVHDILQAPKDTAARYSAGFTEVQFPVRLGSPSQNNEYNDGLIGFFKSLDNDPGRYDDLFYTHHGNGTDDGIVELTDTTVRVTAAEDGPPVTLLVLMDPRGRLQATSGILPKKSLEIPAAYYEGFYQTMAATFLTSPVLHHLEVRSPDGENGIDLPLPSDGKHQWQWIAKYGDIWQERTIFSRPEKLAVSTDVTIGEGWLKLVNKSKEDT